MFDRVTAAKSTTARRRWGLAMACSWSLGLALFGTLACRGVEGTRVSEIRPRDADPAFVPRPGDLATLTPSATPTFPTLTLRPPHASEVHMSRGWRKSEADLAFRGLSTVRFWVGSPRPLRLKGAARLVSTRRQPKAVLQVSVGAAVVGSVELTGQFESWNLEVGQDGVLPGTNLISLQLLDPDGLAPLSKLVAVNELVVEDGEDPRAQPARPVGIVLEGEEGERSGVEVRRGGPLSFLLHPPGSERELELGVVCRAPLEATPRPPRFQVLVTADGGGETLLEGAVSYDEVQWHRVPLGSFGGSPLQLTLALDRIPEGVSCLWVEPRLGHTQRHAPEHSSLEPESLNVIILLLDAATRDRFGIYGSEESTTDAIDALAAESLVLDRAYVQASYTLASTASLFTGRLPPVHGVARSNVREAANLPRSVPTLAGVLGERGYRTAMITGNPNSVRNGLSAGFQHVDELYRRQPGTVALAEEFHQPALDWVDESGEQPFLLYVHYVQPHEPYDVAPERFYRLDTSYDGEFDGSAEIMGELFGGRRTPGPDDVEHLRRLYHGNLRYADWAVGELVAALDDRGLLERSILVVTSDHGEALGERGVFGHGRTVDRELAPMPLVIRFPSRLGLTGRRDFLVGSVDLLPTILEAVGAPVPDGIWGSSVLSALDGGERTGWLRPLPCWAGGAGHAGTVAVYGAGDFKYTYDSITGEERLFTVAEEEDGEDLRPGRPVTFEYLAFSSYITDATAPATDGSTEELDVDEPDMDALRALGYVE